MDEFLSSSDAARILEVTPAAVRAMARRGALPVAAKTESGIRLFDRAAVLQLRRERDNQKDVGEED